MFSGSCGRCGMPIHVGDAIYYDRPDFSGPVHDGCLAPAATIRTARPSSAPRATLPMTVAASRPARTDQAAASPQPPLCPGCHLEHAGECW